MSEEKDNFKGLKISRKDFMKMMGAGSLFLGLGAFGISNILKTFPEASASKLTSPTNRNVSNMTSPTISNATNMTSPAIGKGTDIRPFRVNFPEADLTELRRRIKATRLPEKETEPDQGVQLAVIQAVVQYWTTDYDWRKIEAKLNAVLNFNTEIDGLDIHFIHVRSKHANALPLIVSHGWPGSPIEQLKIIDPLTNPTAHGGSALDAFHLVIPSMAGYGFSGRPTTPGWDPARMSRAWVTLMKRDRKSVV